MSETPLSDLMDVACKGKPEAFQAFFDAFCVTSVGVIAGNAPANTYGSISSTDESPLTVGMTEHDGKKYILVCADFYVFIERYPGNFNAEMTGIDAFKTVLSHSDTEGVFVNSAKSETSLIIPRKQIAEYMGVSPSSLRHWWQFWKK